MAEPAPDPGSRPEDLFARWLAVPQGEIEDLCRAQPAHAHRLREIHARWREMEGWLARAGLGLAPLHGSSFAARLRQRYGPAVAPLLAEDRAKSAPPTSALMKRLAEHGLEKSRYSLRGELARGGMGAILEVWDEDLRRPLAMKVILGRDAAPPESMPALERQLLARFLEEAQVTGQLDHPGIVPVHELGLDAEGRVYFTMKLVKGRDLKAIFELVFEDSEGWNETRALGVLLKVCEALAYAHTKGVIHRDLKPANVMVGSFGEVYVMDWGLARVLGRKDAPRAPDAGAPRSSIRTERRAEREEAPDSPLFTMDGDVVGTPTYMPPEQAQGQLERLSARADVYAIGAMLYHLLARQLPYVPPDARMTNRTVLGMVLQGPPTPLARLRRDVPAELVAIVERAMARAPEERYADTLELGDDLRAFLEHRVVKAYRTGAVAELAKWVERNRGLAASVAAAVLLLIVGLTASLVFKARADANAALARENAEVALENERRARASEQVALARAEDVLRLSALQELDDLTAEAERLWPAHPERIEAFEAWLARADALVAGLPAHAAKLAELRALPPDAEAPTSADAGNRWWRTQLQKLVDGLTAFSAETGLASRGVSPAHGWGIAKRLDFAVRMRAGFAPDGEYARAWSEALPALHARYPGSSLTPQVGLVPLGPDPHSGLWEFGHLQTGAPARRDAGGGLVLGAETGLVLVLVPDGTFHMGAQRNAPGAPNHDSDAESDEGPVHEVTLPAFFLAKHEMTQAQWLRFTGRNPSNYAPGTTFGGNPTTLLHPLENVDWTLCSATLARLGLELPAEAQWEYAARAGTTSPRWTGGEKESLDGAANLADSFCKRSGGSSGWVYEEWMDDGYMIHAPVGTYAANEFGLHDVLGNVWEWCADPYAPYAAPDGARASEAPPPRVPRGGGYDAHAKHLRSSERGHVPPEYADANLGVRPARRIAP